MYRVVVLVLVPLLATWNLWGEQNPQPAAPTKLSLIVVEGNDTINNVKQRTSRETIVQVEDENHRPVAGAAVAFLLPDSGPGGTFAGASKSATVVTDAQGRAVMPRMTTNQLTGQYQIRVNASFRGQQASITIAQQNVAAAAAAAAAGGLSTKLLLIIAGVAAAGATAGAVVATRGGGTTTTATPTGSISAGGTATVGGPR